MPAPAFRYRADRLLWWTIAAAAAARLLSLGLYPLMDTTEARYAEIGRKMVELGDWVTPWVDYGVPFWGKPPLSFWMTATGFSALGLSEFAARFPNWLAALLAGWIIWDWFARRSRREAMIAVSVAAGALVFFLSAGAVMTDMALLLGTTLAMRGYWLGLNAEPARRRREQGLLFLGLAIGLLAKGPIALVLAGLPIAAWTLGQGRVIEALRELRWFAGLLLTASLVLPWYLLAESRTPGFLEYFLIGEHWHRFVTSGWQGDLYGSAHAFPRGSIWLFAIAALLPWSLALPVARLLWRRQLEAASFADRPLGLYLLCWAFAPVVFFTFSGNVLWTYVLPCVPAFAMWNALWLARVPRSFQVDLLLAGGTAATILLVASALVMIHFGGLGDKNSTRCLIAESRTLCSAQAPLVFFHRRPDSAVFYSRGAALLGERTEEVTTLADHGPVCLAVDREDLKRIPPGLGSRLRPIVRRGDVELFELLPPRTTP